MKKLRNYLLLLVCGLTAASAFTSCNSDDDTSIDPATYKTYLSNISGSYSGKMTFWKVAGNSSSKQMAKYDSVMTAAWAAKTDSTITIYNFPVNKLDSIINVTSSTSDDNKLLCKAIGNCEPQNLKAYYGIPSTNYVTSTYIAFVVNPQTIQLTLNYGEKEHKVYLVFSTNYYMGTWTASSRKLDFQMLLAGIYVDSTTSPLSSSDINYIGITCASN